VLLEVFEGANKIDDAGDAQVFCCAGAGFHGDWAQWSRTALGEKNAIDTCAIGHAEQRAEVLRIFNAVDRENEASGGVACGGKGREEVLEGEKFLRADERDDALVSGGFGGDGELLTRPSRTRMPASRHWAMRWPMRESRRSSVRSRATRT
jgi:hypothetical protein